MSESTEGMWHLSPVTGKPERCRAEKGGCPYGEHYATESEAQVAYEARNQKEFGLFPKICQAAREEANYYETQEEASAAYDKAVKTEAETKTITESFDEFEKTAQSLAYTDKGYSDYSLTAFSNVEVEDDSIQLTMEKHGGVNIIVTGNLDDYGDMKSAYVSGYGEVAEEERDVDSDSYTWDFLQTVAENPHDFI